MFFVVDGWLCFCLCSIVHFFCASFRSVVCCLCSLRSCPGIRCLLPVVLDCVFVAFVVVPVPLSVGFRRFCVCAMEFFDGWQILIVYIKSDQIMTNIS